MVNGATVNHWTAVNFSILSLNTVKDFIEALIGMCTSKGMVFNQTPLVEIKSAHPNKIEETLAEIHRQSMSVLASKTETGGLDLLMVILPHSGGQYGKIKKICETELGVITQCCRPKQAKRLNRQCLENLSLKINVKAGGRNNVLSTAFTKHVPWVSQEHTIIFGADVNHPRPGDDSSPSIAAVVASMDWPGMTKYKCLISAQPHRQELIQELYKVDQDPQKGACPSGMIRELLRSFQISTGQKPRRIIFYRDGVSEGQFNQVLLHELNAIRLACSSFEEGYLPLVTFVVAQKRHHTRLFPAEHENPDRTIKSGNIIPGTIVDTQICHPAEFDFYLCSHASTQGTSRPTHYHVLWDDNKFTADQLQNLTNSLCYMYARCTRSVSVVPPVYYARLAASRARYYMGSDFATSEISSGAKSGNAEIRKLPAIKDNVKDLMFFC